MIDVGPIVNEGHGLVVTSGQGRPVREVSEHRGAGAPRKRTGPVVDSRYRNHTVTFINVIVVVIVEVIVIVIVVVETDFVDGGAVFLDAREATDVLPLPDFHDVRRHLGGVGVLLGQEGRGGREGGKEGGREAHLGSPSATPTDGSGSRQTQVEFLEKLGTETLGRHHRRFSTDAEGGRLFSEDSHQ